MGKTTKYVVLEVEFEDDNPEPPYIKDWWLRNHATAMVESNIDYIRRTIDGVSVSCSVKMLPNEICLSIEELIKGR